MISAVLTKLRTNAKVKSYWQKVLKSLLYKAFAGVFKENGTTNQQKAPILRS